MIYTNIKQKRLIFDGDSLFARGNNNLANGKEAPTACYNGLTGIRPPMMNFAISGRTITQLISEFPTKIQPYIQNGDVLVMNELTNELANIQDPTLVYNTLISYCNMATALNLRMYILTMTARNTGYPTIENDRLTLNTLIRNNYTSFCNGLIDVGGLTEFNSIAATANATYYNADTLHFTSAGYTLYGQSITPIIQYEFS